MSLWWGWAQPVLSQEPGGLGALQDHSQSLGWAMQCPALSSQLPGLGFLQASLLTIHTFKESSAAPFFPIVFLAP